MTSSASPINPPSNPFKCPFEQNSQTPRIRKWSGSDPSKQRHLPQFKNYQFRYGAYPGYRDSSKNPPWPDAAVEEHVRRQESPVKAIVGKKGRTTFKSNERVCGDLKFGKPKAKTGHEFIWYYMKDPNQFDLKSPRRWDPTGTSLHPPKPFYNREDGHFLLNNTCTIANLYLMPELRRLQCYFFPKLPKVRKEMNFNLPMKKHGRQHASWRWTETWSRPQAYWYTNNGPDEPEVAQFKEIECHELDKENANCYYLKNKRSIEELRAWHRRVKVATPRIKSKPIDYHVKLGKETINGVLKVKELFEDPILWFFLDPPVDIMEIILAEEAERKRLAEEAKKKNPSPPPPPSICNACNYYGDCSVIVDKQFSECTFH